MRNRFPCSTKGEKLRRSDLSFGLGFRGFKIQNFASMIAFNKGDTNGNE